MKLEISVKHNKSNLESIMKIYNIEKYRLTEQTYTQLDTEWHLKLWICNKSIKLGKEILEHLLTSTLVDTSQQ